MTKLSRNMLCLCTSIMALQSIAGISQAADYATDYVCPVVTSTISASTTTSSATKAQASAPIQVIATPQTYEQNNDYPKWGDFPPPPKDIPTPQDIKQWVVELQNQRNVFQAQFKQVQWDNVDPLDFTQQTLAQIEKSRMEAIDDFSCQQMIDFSNKYRKMAEPPPIIDR